MAPVLGYWDTRGLAEPIRFLLNYAGVEFEDKRYAIRVSAPKTPDRSQWQKVKETLGLDFPNLPYYMDDDVKLTQSLAIMRYLARKYDLDGKTEREKQQIDILEQLSHDLFVNLVRSVAFNPDIEKAKSEYKKTLPGQLGPLSKFLAEKTWFVGDRITHVDFLLHDRFDQFRLLDPSCLDEFSNLKEFMDRFEALPTVKSYMESERYKAWPLYGPHMYWGYDKA